MYRMMRLLRRTKYLVAADSKPNKLYTIESSCELRYNTKYINPFGDSSTSSSTK